MKEITIIIISSSFTMISVLIPAYWLHSREKRKYKSLIREHELKGNILDRILDFTLLSNVKEAVTDIFEHTIADRFLILIAINGKVDFTTVSVIFEQHRHSTSSAIATYRNLNVDSNYVQLLKNSEKDKVVELNTINMENSLLKTIYLAEGVTNSQIRHISRINLDANNDCLIFSSIATHIKKPFNTMDKIKIQTQIDSVVKPAIEKMLR